VFKLKTKLAKEGEENTCFIQLMLPFLFLSMFLQEKEEFNCLVLFKERV